MPHVPLNRSSPGELLVNRLPVCWRLEGLESPGQHHFRSGTGVRIAAAEGQRQPFLPGLRLIRVKGEHPGVFRFGLFPPLFFHIKAGQLQGVGRLGFAAAGEENGVDEAGKAGGGDYSNFRGNQHG